MVLSPAYHPLRLAGCEKALKFLGYKSSLLPDCDTHGAHQVDLSEDVVHDDSPVTAEFTYSVKWLETDTPYEKRMDKYRRYSFLPQHLEVVRWSPQHSWPKLIPLTVALHNNLKPPTCAVFHGGAVEVTAVGASYCAARMVE